MVLFQHHLYIRGCLQIKYQSRERELCNFFSSKVSTRAQLDPLQESMHEFLLLRCSIEQIPQIADTLLLAGTACHGGT